jgi:hypothetical protein
MKLPKHYSNFKLVKTGPGTYTAEVRYEGVKPDSARRWLHRNGKRLLEEQLGYEIREVGNEYKG